jgi:arginyl-tRNA synthetase
LIVRKSDGGFGYAATDLAAVRFRVSELGAQRIVYVVDARQSQHFAMVFAAARLAGWLEGDSGEHAAQHVPFGTILGADGRPFKTRSGDTVKLADLLDEAEQRAAAVVAEKSADLPPSLQGAVARAVGIGAVKYADLSSDRIKDYVFDWDRMLSFDGNTAPYLQYAYVRIRSIFRRGEIDPLSILAPGPISLAEPEERALALTLLQFDGVVRSTAAALAPHRLTGYLFELAQAFTAFFEACPVLRAPSDDLRRSRLALCEITARVLGLGLGLLGIETVEQM